MLIAEKLKAVVVAPSVQEVTTDFHHRLYSYFPNG